MAGKYGYKRRYASSGNRYFKRRCTTRPQMAMAKYIRNVVSASTQQMVTYPRTDPPNFKLDRPMKRRVRVVLDTTKSNVSAQDIALAEASYYGMNSPRWTTLKVLAVTAYGYLPQKDGGDNGITLQYVASGQDVAGTSYSDRGDGNHRACIKLINPPTTPVIGTSNQTAILNFPGNTVALIDFYVEFS